VKTIWIDNPFIRDINMDLFERFITFIEALNKEDVDYVLVGGYAVILYGMPRMTQDIDIFVNPHDDNIIRLKKALFSVFHDMSIEEINRDMLVQYQVVRYGSADGFYIDIITRLGEAFCYEDITWDSKEVDGHMVRIAKAETLYKMKNDTVRAIDKADALYLHELMKKKKNDL